MEEDSKFVHFRIGDMHFEYDEAKNLKNIEKHGISFQNAARIFFDYDRIEFFDEENSICEERYDTIGKLDSERKFSDHQLIIGNIRRMHAEDIVFVVYTERIRVDLKGKSTEVIRLISARLATSFERGLYYGKYE